MTLLLIGGVACLGVAAAIVTTVFLFEGKQEELHQEEPLVEEGEILG